MVPMAPGDVRSWLPCVVIGIKAIPLHATEERLVGVYPICDDPWDNIVWCEDSGWFHKWWVGSRSEKGCATIVVVWHTIVNDIRCSGIWHAGGAHPPARDASNLSANLDRNGRVIHRRCFPSFIRNRRWHVRGFAPLIVFTTKKQKRPDLDNFSVWAYFFVELFLILFHLSDHMDNGIVH